MHQSTIAANDATVPSSEMLADQLLIKTSETANLTGYTALASDDRASIIEQAIIRSIQSDDFIQFCLDFEGSWQRIGLDLRMKHRE